MLHVGTLRLGDSKGLAQEPGCVSEKNKTKQSTMLLKVLCEQQSMKGRSYKPRCSLSSSPTPAARLDAGVGSHRALKGHGCAEGVGSGRSGAQRSGGAPRKAGPEGSLQETHQLPHNTE